MLRERSVRDESSFLAVPASQPQVCTPLLLTLRARYLDATVAASRSRAVKLAALAALGVTVGVGGAVLGVSLVQASDRLDMYETFRSDGRGRREQAVPAQAYTSASSYAAQRSVVFQPLAAITPQNRVAFPDFRLNPFHPTGHEQDRTRRADRNKQQAKTAVSAALDTVSGAADVPRSICVRLCDGYQYPLGYIRDNAELVGHEALCRAIFPDVPTRVMRVAAGAGTIDEAVGSDGKTYRSLPMAYAYQTSIDPACARPRNGARTVSLLKDFTLRAGDTVMVNGRPRVFIGSTSYPFTAANFRDFRSSAALSESTRKQIDHVVGVSREESLRREVQRITRVREANALSGNRAVDIVSGGVRLENANGQPTTRTTPARVIDLSRR
ncbi:MAG: DUF2865 domain-containing protein [Hyphomicrobiales bacterium]|nr:DUF2865 domain-containing protein [Hyphomicrobiales bacterium]